jgi:hypothetical protein
MSVPSRRTMTRECRVHGMSLYVWESRGYYRCRQCRASYSRSGRDKRRARLVRLHGGRCRRCAYDRLAHALEFHHREPSEKKFQLSKRGLTQRFAILLEELAKCDLLCGNCHAEDEAAIPSRAGPKSLIVIRHRRRRKLELIAVRGGACQICSFSSSAAALQFHHVNPRLKAFALSAGTGLARSRASLLEELAKCILVCCNCHSEVGAGLHAEAVETLVVEHGILV